MRSRIYQYPLILLLICTEKEDSIKGLVFGLMPACATYLRQDRKSGNDGIGNQSPMRLGF